MKKRTIRTGLIFGMIVLLLCVCISASAASKIRSFPKGNELYLQWKPFGDNWKYPEIRDEGDRIIIEGASSLGFTARAMQTYIFRQYPKTNGFSSQWDVLKEKKKGNGLDQIILLKPTAEQIANLPDETEPRSDYPIDSNPDFDLTINRVKSPLESIRIIYNPRWKIEEGGLTFLLWYKSKDRCNLYPGGIDLHYYCKITPGKDDPFYGFSLARYDTEGRLTRSTYYQKKTGARYDYNMVSEQPLYYALTDVSYESWVYSDGIWKNKETGEETQDDPKGINLKKLPFKIIGDPGSPPEAADIIASAYRNSDEVIRTESAPGPVELPRERAVYSAWPACLPLPEPPKMAMEDLGDNKSRITLKGLAGWNIPPQSLCPYEPNSDNYYFPAGKADESGIMTIESPTGSNPSVYNMISPSEYWEIYCDTENSSFIVNLQRGETTYTAFFSEQFDDYLDVQYPFPDGRIVASYDTLTGILSSYTVYIPWEGKELRYSYRATADKLGNRELKLHYITLCTIEDGNTTDEEEYSYSSGNWRYRGADGYADCDPPPFADQCEPLPIIRLVP